MKKFINNYYRACQAGFVLMLALAAGNNAQAQYKRMAQPNPNRMYLGFESGIGSTAYSFDSNIKDLKDLKVSSEGWNAGLIFGNNDLKLRTTGGKYAYKPSLNKSISQTLLSGNINVSPSSLFGKSKYFRAYILTGMDYSIFKFDGITIPALKDPYAGLNNTQKKKVCICDDGLAPPADPGPPSADMVMDDETDPKQTIPAKDVSLKKAQINTGLGIELNAIKNGKFLRMFAEARYGIPLKEMISDFSLSKTSVSSQLVFNFGVSFGLTK